MPWEPLPDKARVHVKTECLPGFFASVAYVELILAVWTQALATVSMGKAWGLQEATARTQKNRGSIKKDQLSAAATSLGSVLV